VLEQVARPASAVSPLTSGIGFLGFCGSLALLIAWKQLDTLRCVVLACAVAATLMALTELLVFNVSKRESTGLDWHATPRDDWSRVMTKLAGLLATMLAVGTVYWLAPEYHAEFYLPYYKALVFAVPLWLLIAVPYFWYVDRLQRNPHDGYWHMGLIVTGRAARADRAVLSQHLLGWVVKGYFLPLMLVYLVQNVDWLRFTAQNPWRGDWLGVYEAAFRLTFIIDLAFCVIGYTLSLRVIDSHMRSVEPTLFGWLVTLVCYEPFWSLINSAYLNYESGRAWVPLLEGRTALAWIWGGVIIALLAVYSWATVVFGLRFSNLTHRGIITNGPYRWVRHPAYFCKSLSWWLIAVPFIPLQGNLLEAVRLSALLLLLNAVYVLRAWTEERHLRRDPAYVRYAEWIDQHGLVACLRRLFPVVSFARRKTLV
jgi:protein-S-isoprenylcysteine O-methyltransferase Ste14